MISISKQDLCSLSQKDPAHFTSQEQNLFHQLVQEDEKILLESAQLSQQLGIPLPASLDSQDFSILNTFEQAVGHLKQFQCLKACEQARIDVINREETKRLELEIAYSPTPQIREALFALQTTKKEEDDIVEQLRSLFETHEACQLRLLESYKNAECQLSFVDYCKSLLPTKETGRPNAEVLGPIMLKMILDQLPIQAILDHSHPAYALLTQLQNAAKPESTLSRDTKIGRMTLAITTQLPLLKGMLDTLTNQLQNLEDYGYSDPTSTSSNCPDQYILPKLGQYKHAIQSLIQNYDTALDSLRSQLKLPPCASRLWGKNSTTEAIRALMPQHVSTESFSQAFFKLTGSIPSSGSLPSITPSEGSDESSDT